MCLRRFLISAVLFLTMNKSNKEKTKESHLELTVIIPTLNEAKNITWVINNITKHTPPAKIIVADDGSTDGTQAIIKEHYKYNQNITLFDRTQKIHGLTASVIDAILNVKTKYFVVIDGDGQHPPEKINEFVEQFMRDAVIVVGVRECVANKWGFYRHSMSKIATALSHLRLHLTGTLCSDPLSGFFGAETAIVKNLLNLHRKSFVDTGYKVLFDLLKLQKFKVVEVPYTFGLRKGGESKIKSTHIIDFLKSVIK